MTDKGQISDGHFWGAGRFRIGKDVRKALRWGCMPAFSAAFLAAFVVPHRLLGQALPTASADPVSTGFRLPTTAGSLSFSLSANENLTSGFYNDAGWQTASSVSGNLAMITSSRSYPFSMILSGGRSFSTSAEPSTNYVDLAVSQVINTPRWGFVVSDAVSYLPATPSVGLSGVAGTGDVGLTPVQVGTDAGVGVLTAYSDRVSNGLTASATRHITARISAGASGSYTMTRFVGASSGAGINSDGFGGNGSLSYALDARSSLSGNYSYSRSLFNGSLGGFTSQTVSVSYSHQFSRRLSMNAAVGPQWSQSDAQTVSVYTGLIAPGTSHNLFVSTGLAYSEKNGGYSLAYSRGTNSGFGVIPGGRSDSVSFSASRTFDRVWSVSTNAAFTRTTAVNATSTQNFAPKTFVVAAQTSRALLRSLSVFGSYTLEKQSGVNTGAFGVFDLFSGSFQVFAVGLTYAPPGIHFGPR